MRMQFHLIGGWFDAGVAQNQFQFGLTDVRGANVFHETHIDKFFQLPPRFHEIFVDVGHGMGITGGHVYTRIVMVGEGPVD